MVEMIMKNRMISFVSGSCLTFLAGCQVNLEGVFESETEVFQRPEYETSAIGGRCGDDMNCVRAGAQCVKFMESSGATCHDACRGEAMDGICAPPCRHDMDCEDGMKCSPAGYCLLSCKADLDCWGDWSRCHAGLCVSR